MSFVYSSIRLINKIISTTMRKLFIDLTEKRKYINIFLLFYFYALCPSLLFIFLKLHQKTEIIKYFGERRINCFEPRNYFFHCIVKSFSDSTNWKFQMLKQLSFLWVSESVSKLTSKLKNLDCESIDVFPNWKNSLLITCLKYIWKPFKFIKGVCFIESTF